MTTDDPPISITLSYQGFPMGGSSSISISDGAVEVTSRTTLLMMRRKIAMARRELTTDERTGLAEAVSRVLDAAVGPDCTDPDTEDGWRGGLSIAMGDRKCYLKVGNTRGPPALVALLDRLFEWETELDKHKTVVDDPGAR